MVHSGISAQIPAATLAAQASFRAVMSAMARPGSLHKLAEPTDVPPPLMPATAAMALALFDHDTPIWLDAEVAQTSRVADWLTFNTSAPVITEPSRSAFALIANGAALPPLASFSLGSGDYPDRSTTLLIQVESLTNSGRPVTLTGPGINGTARLDAMLQPLDLLDRLAEIHPLFPLGIDVVLVAGSTIVALPRSTRFAAREG